MSIADQARQHSTPGTPAFLRTFADPRGDSAPMPFWMWNGDLEEAEIRRQIGLMDTAGVEAFVIHAREGLETPYLSEEWFGLVKTAVEEAMARRMKVFLYDELNWPSGYAGGKLVEKDPTKCAHHLARVRMETHDRESLRYSLAPGEQLVAALTIDGEGIARAVEPETLSPPGSESLGVDHAPPHPGITGGGVSQTTAHQPIPLIPRKTSTPLRFPLPKGTITVDLYISRPTSFSVTYRPGLRYTDLLDPEAVRLFISLTHDHYLQHLHDYFGTTILGFFTDEPGFYNNSFGCDPGTIPWTAGFPDHFRDLKGYDLLPRLAALWQPATDGDATDPEAVRVRADYFDALADRYRTSYFEQLHNWCRANGLQLIGHLLGEEDLLLTARSQGDFFRHFRHMDQAGVDLVGQVSEEQSVSVRLGASAALHLGHGQLQSETFGIFGWELTLEHMRYTTDWQAVRGLTRLIPHAFHYSMAGNRHRECPPSLFFQNCWWPLYPRFQTYGRRLFAALEQGRPHATVALFYPLPAVWASLSTGQEGEEAARRIDAAFRGIALALERTQIDFHILDAGMIGRADMSDGALALSGCRYTALILPECQALPAGMAEKLERFTTQGGLLAAVGALPEMELADVGGETDPLTEWSSRLFADTEQEDRRTIFVPRPQTITAHPGQGPRTLSLLRSLRKIGAAVTPRLEAKATARYKRWLSQRRDQTAETVAGSIPFAGLVESVTTHNAPALRVLPPDPEIRHLWKEIEGSDGGALVFLLNQGESEKRFTTALAHPGKPWRLAPSDGSITAVHRYSVDQGGGRILMPLTLPPHGSALFYLERSGSVRTRVEETNLDEVLILERRAESPPDLAGIAWSQGKKWARVVETGANKPQLSNKVAKQTRQEWFLIKYVGELPKPMDLAHGWEIRFLPMEGGQFDDPLRKKWPDEMVLSNQPLQDWRTIGRGQFSGTAEYTITFELDKDHVGNEPNNTAQLDLGDVRETARVILNGQPVGDLIWPPHQLRVERILRPGQNRLTLVVTNTMANRLEPNPRPSGLLGPVRLIFGKKVRLEFSPEGSAEGAPIQFPAYPTE